MPSYDSWSCFQYLQLKKKLEDEFPGCLDIVSLRRQLNGPFVCPVGLGSSGRGLSQLCPLHLFFILWEGVGVPKRTSQPLPKSSPSP
jgi:hypothetical protein